MEGQQQDRIPAGYADNRRQHPDIDLLRTTGFEPAVAYQFPVPWERTPETLIGFAYSTSVVRACEPSGALRQTIEFAYEPACRPA